MVHTIDQFKQEMKLLAAFYKMIASHGLGFSKKFQQHLIGNVTNIGVFKNHPVTGYLSRITSSSG
jgi:hypothetical protein